MADMLGAYRIVRKLGEGGMATAWLGCAPDGRLVVLKMPLASSTATSIKLRDEAQAGFRIRCPFVVRTIDFFIDRGRPVLVVEYIDGCSLRDLRQKGQSPRPLPAVAVAWIGRAIAEGLAAIHEACDEQGQPLGMLHRDVTAGNILIDQLGVPRLIDLGIARSVENQQEKTQTGMIKGTLRFVAPELLRGSGYSAATDLWALGVSLFEAAVGRQMVAGSPVEVFRTLTQGKHTALRPGEFIEPALNDALRALLCEEASRLRNARAAARMFAAVEQKLAHADPARRTGQMWLAAAVPHASPNADDVDAVLPAVADDGFDGEALGTLLVPGAARGAPPDNPGRIVIGDASSGNAPTHHALPAVELAVGDAAPAVVPATPAVAAASWDDDPLATLPLVRGAHDGRNEVTTSSPVLPAAVPATPPVAAAARDDDPLATLPLMRGAHDVRPRPTTPAPTTPAAVPATLASASMVAAPTVLMPAAPTVPGPAVPATPASMLAAPTVLMPAAPTVPGPAVPATPASMLAAPTVQMPAAVGAAAPAAATPALPAPTLALPTVSLIRPPRLPQLQMGTPQAAPGDVLPAGAATLVMAAWTPPPTPGEAQPATARPTAAAPVRSDGEGS